MREAWILTNDRAAALQVLADRAIDPDLGPQRVTDPDGIWVEVWAASDVLLAQLDPDLPQPTGEELGRLTSSDDRQVVVYGGRP